MDKRARPEWLIAGAVFLLFALVSSRYTGPAYLSDEVGYLGHAALLAGYTIDGASSWHAGYSLLLAPLFKVFSDPVDIWQGVMLLNAAMWAGSFLLLLRLISRFFTDRSTLQHIAAVGVAAVYPTWLTMSGYAFPTTTISFFFLLAVFAALYVDVRRPWSVLPHAMATGFLYWIHPTGLAVVAASTVALAALGYKNRRPGTLVVHVLVISVLLLAYERGLQQWLLDAGTATGFAATEHYPSYASVLSKFGTPEFWLVTGISALGQASYLTVGSLGLAATGFVMLVRSTRKLVTLGLADSDATNMIAAYVALFVLLALVAVVLMGSAGFAATASVDFAAGGRTRVDQWIYGRYAEGVLLPFLAFGFLAGCRRKWLPVLPGALVLCGIALSVATEPGNNHNLVNITSFWPRYLIETPSFLLWMAIGALGVFLFQIGRQEGKIWGCAALVLLLGVSVLSMVNGAQFHRSKYESNRPTGFVQIIRTNFAPGCCVGFDPEMPVDVVLHQEQRFQLHLFYLYDYVYGRMHPSDWLNDCDGPLFTYHIDELRGTPGVVLLGQEVRSGLYLVAKDRAEGFTIPHEDPRERTFYPADGWSLAQDLYRYGEELRRLPTQVGKFENDMIVSTGREGRLAYGPGVAMGAGEYGLVVTGSASSVQSAFVAVASGPRDVEHARLPLATTPEDSVGVLASGRVFLDGDAFNLEVILSVGSNDEVRLTGYELVRMENTEKTGN